MKKVLILGGGYAALSFVKSLSKSTLDKFDFTLVSATSEHYFSILLHEVVSGENSDVCVDIKRILPPQVKFVKDSVKEIKNGAVVCEGGELAYDYLVVALGFSSNDFRIAGISEFSHNIVNFAGAKKLHDELFAALDKSKGEFRLAVCGAGFSGIELISSLAEQLKGRNVSLVCIEAMNSIVPMFKPELAALAKDFCEKRGVKFRLGAKILSCEADGVNVEVSGQKEKVGADFIIWTCGVKGNEVIQNSPFFKSGNSKVEVDETLRPKNQENAMENVFVIGDCAAVKDEKSGRFFPPTAQIATQMGQFLGEKFEALTSGNAGVVKFDYQPKGTICSLGKDYAIADLGGFVSFIKSGKIARWLKTYIEKQWTKRLLG